jgi:hypothetical protein
MHFVDDFLEECVLLRLGAARGIGLELGGEMGEEGSGLLLEGVGGCVEMNEDSSKEGGEHLVVSGGQDFLGWRAAHRLIDGRPNEI